MALVDELLTNKLTLIAGNSGVGKSSLINRLCPGFQLKTNDISWYHLSGKHTTTYPEMIEIKDHTLLSIRRVSGDLDLPT